MPSNRSEQDIQSVHLHVRLLSLPMVYDGRWSSPCGYGLCDALDGGCVAVTMFDKHRVQSLLDQNNGRVVFSVNGKPMVEIKEGRSEDTIDVWIDSIGQSYTEHLLYPEDLLTQEYKILN